ncbi:MAG: ribonucleotide-diphosphate reductase subunit beta [Candidatus Dojkabacteria bacterium]|nr:ribonucleotide-diphosphate reductase subunit beta [Candidatus Dojkabacteria bacterium]MDQ7020285.1 ribonucleotide-diphosphate reductase subunit beta [Candidatus Dojkabacteria bacterium]
MALLKKRNQGDELQLNEIEYEWAQELLDQAIANTWFPHEAPMAEDIQDWMGMSEEEKNAVIMYIGFSNPMEYDVNESITYGMLNHIAAPEVKMYLVRQMWEEVNHALAFDYVINTLEIDRKKAFNTHIDVPEVRVKEEFLMSSIEKMIEGIDVETEEGKKDFVRNIVKTNIVTEGVWFYSGFMFALNFRQRKLLRNFATITDWISRDEALHLKVGINMILTVLEENPDIVTNDFADEIRNIIVEAVELEMNYNKALLPKGILGLNTNFINQYVQYVADRRLEELGFEPEFKVSNPAKWMSTANDTFQLVNFFEAVNTSYEVNAGGIKSQKKAK